MWIKYSLNQILHFFFTYKHMTTAPCQLHHALELIELIKMPLSILSVASAYKYSPEQIVAKINFTMTYSTVYDTNVTEKMSWVL